MVHQSNDNSRPSRSGFLPGNNLSAVDFNFSTPFGPNREAVYAQVLKDAVTGQLQPETVALLQRCGDDLTDRLARTYEGMFVQARSNLPSDPGSTLLHQRLVIINALASIGTPQAMSALIVARHDPESTVKVTAAQHYERLSTSLLSALQADPKSYETGGSLDRTLRTLLISDDPGHWDLAAEKCRQIGPPASDYVPLLAHRYFHCLSGIYASRLRAALEALGPDGQEAVRCIDHGLPVYLSIEDALVLSFINSAGVADTRTLVRCVSDDDEQISENAKEKVASFGEAAIPALVHVIVVNEEELRYHALLCLLALHEHGYSVSACQPALPSGLKDGDSYCRLIAAMIAGCIGPSALDLAPMIQELLHDEDPSVREAAANALSEIE